MEAIKANEEIFICKKCFVKGEYMIPLFQINEKTNEIEYKCSKKHNIGINDVMSMKPNKDLLLKLSKCHNQNHKEYFCGWSEEEANNLCFYDIGTKIDKKEKYILFSDIYPNISENEQYYLQIIDSLKEFLNKYSNKSNKEISNMKNIAIIIENSFYMHYTLKLINYQVIINLSYSLSIMPSKNEIDYFQKNTYIYLEMISLLN